MIDDDGNLIVDDNGNPIVFLDDDGKQIVFLDGNQIVDDEGNPIIDFDIDVNPIDFVDGDDQTKRFNPTEMRNTDNEMDLYRFFNPAVSPESLEVEREMDPDFEGDDS